MSSTEKNRKFVIFGNRVTERMDALGLKLKDVSDPVGVTPSAVSEWRQGRSTPNSRDKLVALTKILQTSEAWLFGETDEQPKVSVPPNASIIEFPYIEVPAVGKMAAGSPGRSPEDLYEGESVMAEGLKGREAIAITIEGDSMSPDYRPGQRVVVVKDDRIPLETGKPVAVKDLNGNVFFKLYFPKGEKEFTLRSINSKLYPDIRFSVDDIEWIYKAHGMYVRF